MYIHVHHCVRRDAVDAHTTRITTIYTHKDWKIQLQTRIIGSMFLLYINLCQSIHKNPILRAFTLLLMATLHCRTSALRFERNKSNYACLISGEGLQEWAQGAAPCQAPLWSCGCSPADARARTLHTLRCFRTMVGAASMSCTQSPTCMCACVRMYACLYVYIPKHLKTTRLHVPTDAWSTNLQAGIHIYMHGVCTLPPIIKINTCLCWMFSYTSRIRNFSRIYSATSRICALLYAYVYAVAHVRVYTWAYT